MTPEGARNYLVVNQATFASLADWHSRTSLADLRMGARTF